MSRGKAQSVDSQRVRDNRRLPPRISKWNTGCLLSLCFWYVMGPLSLAQWGPKAGSRYRSATKPLTANHSIPFCCSLSTRLCVCQRRTAFVCEGGTPDLRKGSSCPEKSWALSSPITQTYSKSPRWHINVFTIPSPRDNRPETLTRRVLLRVGDDPSFFTCQESHELRMIAPEPSM